MQMDCNCWSCFVMPRKWRMETCHNNVSTLLLHLHPGPMKNVLNPGQTVWPFLPKFQVGEKAQNLFFDHIHFQQRKGSWAFLGLLSKFLCLRKAGSQAALFQWHFSNLRSLSVFLSSLQKSQDASCYSTYPDSSLTDLFCLPCPQHHGI